MHNQTLNRFEWLKSVMQAEGLTPTAKNVATALAVQFANAETGQINPSQKTLADYLKVHCDTIKRVLRELRNAGWLMSIGDGGRGKAPKIRLLSPGKIVPFRASKGGANDPAQAEKRRDDLQQKEGQITPSHNKDKQSLEQRGRDVPTRRPVALDQFMQTRFAGNPTDGPRIVPKTDWNSLNAWSEWLHTESLPQPIDLPLVQSAEKTGDLFFWFPSKKPPQSHEAAQQARAYFQALIDWEGARHAAQ